MKLNEVTVYTSLLRLQQQSWIDFSWGVERPEGRGKPQTLHHAMAKIAMESSWEHLIARQCCDKIRFPGPTVGRREVGTKNEARFLDGCPMFAKAYMGREWVFQMLSLHCKGIPALGRLSSTRVVEALEGLRRSFSAHVRFGEHGAPIQTQRQRLRDEIPRSKTIYAS